MPSAEALDALTPEQRKGNFHTSALWRRVLIVLAGPFANFLLGVVIFTGLALAMGIVHQEAQITCVEPGTPAAKAGLEAGGQDCFHRRQACQKLRGFQHVREAQCSIPHRHRVDRGGKQLNFLATPELTEGECVGRLGVVGGNQRDDAQIVSAGMFEALGIGFERTWQIIQGPFQFFDQLIRGNACASSLGGPVKIAEVAKSFASEGFVNLIPLIAFISVSVGLFNLFPIPVLDGGHLLFYGAEAILGRPLDQRAQEIGFQFGLFCFLC